MKIKIIFLIILFTLFLIITINTYANTVFNGISDSFFRLHVIANSDSTEDQDLKLKVRDGILEYISSLDLNNKSDVIYFSEKHKSDFNSIAENIILENGFDYDVNIEIGNFYFPTKYYGNISLPAGFYDALKIEIGNSAGQNWWCSLFPPLCFVDISSGVVDSAGEKTLEDTLSEEEFSIISGNSEDVKFKFKLIEVLNEKNIL